MWRNIYAAAAIASHLLPSAVAGTYDYYTTADALLPASQDPFRLFEKRPEDCPPCFNCNLDDFTCLHGKCACPPGFGGEDCSAPLCGSLAEGKDRLPREGGTCECNEGWEGINCNVCKTDDACGPMMPSKQEDGAVCYREGLVVHENYQMCDITNRKIVDQLKEKKPQATFSCNADRAECNFQFWVAEKESFYCALDTCAWKAAATETQNSSTYRCENIQCQCIPGRLLCGAENSIDIGDFLDQEIRGPATFSTVHSQNARDDGSKFSEPAMNGLISSVFGDESIQLQCHSGECLYRTEIPGYSRPIKKINTPLIAGVIAGCALFVVAVILLVFFLGRRKTRRYGPIQLGDDEEEENAKLLADHKPAALYFDDVCYSLKGKRILSGITGAVHPGELLAIMGASGAGKTSFLDILARKAKRGLATGAFWLNGEKVPDDEFRAVIGFVDQEDTMLPTLTVHETILDSALLRLPKEMSVASKVQKVEDVERQLGIYAIRHQVIGSEDGASGRGISGGEKRRVGIACELVTSPSILFLDEPTSGLDAFNAFNVVECLVTLVKTYNRTVVFTIHQPRSNIVALFDQLVLLAQGRTVYSGPFGKCQAYFDGIGYACPPGFNIADYLVDLTMHAGSAPFDPAEHGVEVRFEGNGATRASSTRAVKSVKSASNVSVVGSMGSVGQAAEPQAAVRPKGKRKASIRQQQERQLYSRKNTAEQPPPAPAVSGGSVRSEGDSLLGDDERQQWVKMARQQGPPPPLPLMGDEAQDLSPVTNAAVEGTGTDLDLLIAAYNDSDVAATLREDIEHATTAAAASTAHSSTTNGHPPGQFPNGSATPGKVKTYNKPRLPTQFLILARRTWRNIYRNPQLMLTHYAIAILLAVFIGVLFYGIADDLAGFQNRLGFFFFILSLFAFSTLTSLTVFATERLLFVRERAKGYYHPLAYYAAKVVFDIVPLRLIPPLIMGVIVYPMTGLVPAWAEFAKFLLFIVLFNLAAATVCLFIGILVRNQGVASLVGVLVMLFSLLFGGFLLNHHTIPPAVAWLQELSIFHYAFEGLIVNEARYLSLVDKQYGLDIEVPGSAILSSFGFDTLALWRDAIGLGAICGGFLVLGYAALHVFLVEKR
ncbi:FAD-dependent urate hydroxylase [Teratosphaeriaceae sp. CCFEE 6253]|nr:FAD-dependent urate hydroxylase [Teratosphaeriaceae sp. CCFEE 6253]